MVKLIDYDEVRRLFNEQYKKTAKLIHNGQGHLDNLAEGFLEADRVIQRIPEVDAVRVVRCRDCKFWDSETGFCEKHSRFYHNKLEWDMFNDDDFCSQGEK